MGIFEHLNWAVPIDFTVRSEATVEHGRADNLSPRRQLFHEFGQERVVQTWRENEIVDENFGETMQWELFYSASPSIRGISSRRRCADPFHHICIDECNLACTPASRIVTVLFQQLLKPALHLHRNVVQVLADLHTGALASHCCSNLKTDETDTTPNIEKVVLACKIALPHKLVHKI